MIDSISCPSVIRALWNLQCRTVASIVHLHTDNGTQLKDLGQAASIHDSASGEELRLLVLLKTVNISASGGQYSSVVESSIKRLNHTNL